MTQMLDFDDEWKVDDLVEVTDEEVLRRDAELEAGSVEPMLHEEFARRVREERSR